MTYRYGSRTQYNLLPSSIEEYVSENDPVRVYDGFIDALDFKELNIEVNEHQLGCSQYDPRTMLKLLVYGYSYGIRSSRKLERAVHHNISFIWLTGGLKPDHKTIANFRRSHKTALHKVLRQCVRVCIKLNLIDGNVLFVDGSKFRANASIDQTWTKKRAQKMLKQIDVRIEELLGECEQIDTEENRLGSLMHVDKELSDKIKRKEKIKAVLAELEKTEKEYINSTDAQSCKTRGRQGSHAGGNVQVVTDHKHGLIVSNDVVNQGNDVEQFANQINQANEQVDGACTTAVADAGYANTDILKEIDDQGITVVVPSQKQASKKELKPFDKEQFIYNESRDCYQCPAGQTLEYVGMNNRKRHRNYRLKDRHICLTCENFGKCTKSSRGRRIIRLANEDTKKKLEAVYRSDYGQEIYKYRKMLGELPFGHMKKNLGAGQFLLRGLDGMKAEISMLSTCFNLTRMITIMGVQNLLFALGS